MRIQGGARGRRVAAGGSAVGAALAALLVVGTLGGSGEASVDEQDPGPAADAAADAALAAALAAWEAFPADAATRPFVVLDAVSGPGGWKSGAAAAKFAAGNWAAPANLPAAPAKYRGYAVLPAADALTVLRTAAGKGSAKKAGAPLKVSDVRLATAPVATDRGVLRLPVWRVTFDAAKGAFRVPAVASPAWYAADGAVTGGPAAAVARDGRTLTLGPAGEGATCAAAKVAESAQAVAVRLADAGCATAVLATGLGNRVLLGVDGDGAVRGPLAVRQGT